MCTNNKSQKLQTKYQQKMDDLRVFGSLEIRNRSIDLLGVLRINEGGVNVFRVCLPGNGPMYGEWRDIFEENGNDFYVLITSFGYADPYNVGNSYPGARQSLSREDKSDVKSLIEGIFAQPELTKTVVPFGIKKARFLYRVEFGPAWTLEN